MRVFSAVLLICNFTGSSAVRYDPKRKTIVKCTIGRITSTIFFATFVFGFIEKMRFLNIPMADHSDHHKEHGQNVMVFLLLTLCSWFYGLSSKMTILLQLRLETILEKMRGIDKLLKVGSSMQTNSIVLVVIAFLHMGALITYTIFQAYFIIFSFSNFLHCITHIGCTCTELQLFSLCYMTIVRARLLNDALLQLSGKDDVSGNIALLHHIHPIHDDYEKFITLIKLQRLGLCHKWTLEIMNHINNTYKFILFTGIVIYTVISIFNFYLIIFGGYMSKRYVEYMFWTPYYVTKLIGVIWIAEKVKCEAQKCRRCIRLLLYQDLDDSCKEQVRYMLKRDTCNNKVFSACGFFNVDFELVSSIITNQITYVLILAQNAQYINRQN